MLRPSDLRASLAASALPETPLVGRSAELAQLQQALQQSRSLLLQGPPGVGKTRMAQELARQPLWPLGVHWLYCRAELQHQPWACLLEFLRGCDCSALQPRECEAVQGLLREQYLGLEQQGSLRAALLRLFEGALVVVDDAHCADMASANLLDALLRDARGPYWLLTRRSHDSGWLPQAGACLELPPLNDGAALDLLQQLNHGSPERNDLKAALARARGLPLFLLAEARHAVAHLADSIASLCNLAEVSHRALGAAAVLGQQFMRADLQALVGADEAERLFVHAAAAGVVVGYHRDAWGFAHPLLREHCLSRLGTGEFAPLAAAAAGLLQARGELARAADLFEAAEHKPSAQQLWLEAAQAALAAEDVVSACSMFERLAALGYPDGLAGAWARLGHLRALILRWGYGISEVAQICSTVDEQLLQTPDAELAFTNEALRYLASGTASRTAGLQQAQRLLGLARTPEQVFAARWAMANTSFFVGQGTQARTHLQYLLAQNLTLEQRTRYMPSDPWAFLSTFHAWLRWYQGDPLWRAEIGTHLSSLQNSSSRQGLCIAHVFSALIALCAGETEALVEHTAQAHEIAQSEAFGFWETHTLLLVNLVAARQGQAPEPEQCARVEQVALRGYPAGANTVRWLLGEAWVAAGCWAQARHWLEYALEQASASEHQYCVPDMQRLLAAALHGCGQSAAAHEALARALELARQLGLPGWVARWQGVVPEQIAQHALRPERSATA